MSTLTITQLLDTDTVPTMFTVQQTIDILALFLGHRTTRQTVRDWIAEGEFPHARKMRKDKDTSAWVIPSDEVAAFLQRNYPEGPLPAAIASADPKLVALTKYLMALPVAVTA